MDGLSAAMMLLAERLRGFLDEVEEVAHRTSDEAARVTLQAAIKRVRDDAARALEGEG